MEQAIADYRQASTEARETHTKSLEAERERDRLKDALAALESNVTSAEQAHADADAAQQLGEASDLEATQAALDAARKALADAAPDLRHKIRVSELLVEKFYTLAREAAAKQQEMLAALNAQLNENLLAQVHEEVAEANRLADALVAAQDKAIASRELFEERRLQAGIVAGWKEEEQKAVYYKNLPHPDPEARRAHKQALQADLAAAARV
ncbi:MAG: hypothetical protein ABIK08_04080 [Pseudomonadota bacterium]